MPMFRVGTAIRVRAFHVMAGMPPPEGERHAHDYRIEVVVERTGLDERGMVCDLDVLNAAVRDMAGRVDGADLEAIKPDDAQMVTVEVLAAWVHGVLCEPVRLAGGEALEVRVWESADEFGGYAAPVS